MLITLLCTICINNPVYNIYMDISVKYNRYKVIMLGIYKLFTGK